MSFFSTTLTLLPLLFTGLVQGQSSPNIQPGSSNNLIVEYGSVAITPPGRLLERSQTLEAPTVGTDATLEGTYVLIMVDADGAPPSRPRREILHWIQGNLTSEAATSLNGTSFASLTSDSPPLASYRPPTPPFEFPPRPHRYNILLFSQPDDFSPPANFSATTRTPFNYSLFVEQSALQLPLAANYLEVQNSSAVSPTASGAPSGGVAPPTGTGVAPPAFTGEASVGPSRGCWIGVSSLAAVALAALLM
ncbi:MAG: hypothetical protein M1837_007278 [Sclerophora amabilis]|nr:MAG: hypothetical protein M1837_007278 [Sclerophora amabilis]